MSFFDAELLSFYSTLYSLLITGLTASNPITLIGCIVVGTIIGSCFYRHPGVCLPGHLFAIFYKLIILTSDRRYSTWKGNLLSTYSCSMLFSLT